MSLIEISTAFTGLLTKIPILCDIKPHSRLSSFRIAYQFDIKCTQTLKSNKYTIFAKLQASNFSIFWLGRKNYMLLVFDILCCPAIYPGAQFPNMILVDAKIIFLSHLPQLNTCKWAFRPGMSLYMNSLIRHKLTVLRFEILSSPTVRSFF